MFQHVFVAMKLNYLRRLVNKLVSQLVGKYYNSQEVNDITHEQYNIGDTSKAIV